MKKALLVLIPVIVVFLLGGCVTPSAPGPTEPAPTPSAPGPESIISLPQPISTGQSVELCLNSRYSYHNPTGTASDQQLSNVLWADGKFTFTGSFRNIYVATPNATYLYDPSHNTLNWYSNDVAD